MISIPPKPERRAHATLTAPRAGSAGITPSPSNAQASAGDAARGRGNSRQVLFDSRAQPRKARREQSPLDGCSGGGKEVGDRGEAEVGSVAVNVGGPLHGRP